MVCFWQSPGRLQLVALVPLAPDLPFEILTWIREVEPLCLSFRRLVPQTVYFKDYSLCALSEKRFLPQTRTAVWNASSLILWRASRLSSIMATLIFMIFVTASKKILFPHSPKNSKQGQDSCEAKEMHSCVWSLAMGNSFSKLPRRFNVQGSSFPFLKDGLLKQDRGFRDVALNVITPLRFSTLWRLIKIRAVG